MRSNSVNTRPIKWEEHEKWFNTKMSLSETTRIFIAEIQNARPVGQIRFDKEGGKAVISYSVDASFRGQNIGTFLVAKGIEMICPIWNDITEIVGVIKLENIASQKIFEKNDFALIKKDPLLEYHKLIKG